MSYAHSNCYQSCLELVLLYLALIISSETKVILLINGCENEEELVISKYLVELFNEEIHSNRLENFEDEQLETVRQAIRETVNKFIAGNKLYTQLGLRLPSRLNRSIKVFQTMHFISTCIRPFIFLRGYLLICFIFLFRLFEFISQKYALFIAKSMLNTV